MGEKNPDGRRISETGLLGLARTIDVDDPAAYGPKLIEALTDYRGGAGPDDDLTLITLHHNATSPPRHSVGSMLKVMAKMVGLVEV